MKRQIPILLVLLVCSCSSEEYLTEADNEVYSIIQDKRKVVLGKTNPFAIDEGEKVEELKPDRERGTYLHPSAYNMPETMGAGYGRNERMMNDRPERP